MGPTGNTRIVQIHPTRRCNLSCKHCYSSSSPQATETVDPALLELALDDLAAEGYDWVTFSGGEPLVYDPLPELLCHARRSGIGTTLVSNGMLLTDKRLDAIGHGIDAVVVSLDGKPDSHNEMRNSPRAFQTMRSNLSKVRKRGIRFGLLFTLTQHNLDELPWIVDFCLEQGADGLLVHPLEITGNAESQLPGKSPDAVESAHAWVLIERLKRKVGTRLNIQLDLVHTSAIDNNPDQFFLGNHATPLQGRLADLLSVLVIEPDGEVVPLQYGFPRQYSLGNLNSQRISEMTLRWQTRIGPEIHKLSRDVHASLKAESGERFVNWYEQLDRRAGQTRTIPFSTRRIA